MTDVEQKIMDEYLTEEFVMSFTGYSRQTVRNFRCEGSDKIPPCRKIGKKWFYPAREFRAWVEKKKVVRSIA